MTQAAIDPTRRFSTRAEFYARARPRYPKALLEFCRTTLGLQPTHGVADVGSGTGFLSELFLQSGNQVFAVEPNKEMRMQAESNFGSNSSFISIDATAEDTGLDDASIDFIVAGQAFHWFDPIPTRREFARILKPKGWVLIVWNERRIVPGGFSEAYEAIGRKFSADKNRGARRAMATGEAAAMKEFFAPDKCERATFSHSHSLDLSGLESLLLSASYMPLPGDTRCDEMLRETRDAFARFQSAGQVVLEYDTNAFYGRLIARP
jgi:SAM-dependent methyltransferase